MFRSLTLGCLLLSVHAVCLPQTPAWQVERGRYLVENVGMCQDCHTPMGPAGLDRARWLKGSLLGFQPTQPIPGFVKLAPDITPAGLLWRSWGEKGIVNFLQTGVAPNGSKANPPMPEYKLSAADAAAVAAYLKT